MQATNCHSHRLDGDDAARYMLAGRATVSVLNRDTGNRFTYKIVTPIAEGVNKPKIWFVYALTGPNNQSDYQYLGFIRSGAYRHGGAKAKIIAAAQSARAFAWLWPRVTEGGLPACIEIWHSGTCRRCGRALTDPVSIETGLGPICREQMTPALAAVQP